LRRVRELQREGIIIEERRAKKMKENREKERSWRRGSEGKVREKGKTTARTHRGATTPAVDIVKSRQTEEDVCGKKTVRTRRKGEKKIRQRTH
jgi:hypothetical protein